METMPNHGAFRMFLLLGTAGLLLAPVSALGQEDKALEGRVRTVALKDGETVTVHARVAEKDKNLVSVVALPDAVQHVLSGWNPKDLSLDHAENRLFVKLLARTEGHLDVVTAAGRHYRILIVPAAPGAEYDSIVTIRRADAADAESGKETAAARNGRASASGALELVRSMRLGEVPPDTSVRSGKGELVIATEEFEASLLYVYETARYRGYVLGLVNRSKADAYAVDFSRFKADGLVLLGARDMVVAPQKATRIYLVFWK